MGALIGRDINLILYGRMIVMVGRGDMQLNMGPEPRRRLVPLVFTRFWFCEGKCARALNHLEQETICEISGSNHGEYVDSCLLP
jgi:hypothetical protein